MRSVGEISGCLSVGHEHQPLFIDHAVKLSSGVGRGEMLAVPAVEVGVSNQALAPMAIDSGVQFHQACSALVAKAAGGFKQGLAAVGAEFGLRGHGLLPVWLRGNSTATPFRLVPSIRPIPKATPKDEI